MIIPILHLVIAAVTGLVAFPASAAPFIPSDDNQVLEELPLPRDPRVREVRRLRHQLVRAPKNLELALRLAARYRELGRSESDPRYYGYAQAALSPWWNKPGPPMAILLLRGVLRQGLHDFDGALQDFSRVLELDQRNAQAWLSKALIHQVRGDPVAAEQSCVRLGRLISSLISHTCFSRAMSLGGKAEQGYASLERAVAEMGSAPPADRLWAFTVLADIAVRLGDTKAAERYFNNALAMGTRDTYLIGAYADFLLDENRPGDVKTLLANETRVDGLLLRLALAEHKLSSPTLSMLMDDLSARFAANRRRGGTLHLREEARFTLYLLDKPAKALGIASRNWQNQREPANARFFLESAQKADDPAAAGSVLDWLHNTKLEDVRIQRLVAQFQ